MALTTGRFSSRPYELRLSVTLNSTDVANNRSRYNYAVSVRSLSGYGTFRLSPLTVTVTINGVNYTVSRSTLDFRPDSTGKTLSIGTGVTGWINHGADGRKSFNFRASTGVYGVFGSAATTNSVYTAARIPKAPSAVRSLSTGSTTPTSVALSWTAPSDNGGASITGYTVQYATNAGFTAGVGTQTFARTSGTVTGLTAGPTYYFRVRANNSRGAGGWSNVVTASPALPAPPFASWRQDTAGRLVATWTPPSPSTGLIGYRIQLATNAAFTAGIRNIDVGNVTTYAVAGLTAGRFWYARVAARTAGGVNVYSGYRQALLVLDAGDLDGWARIGTRPPEVVHFTTPGIRRGIQGGKSALILETLTTGAVTIPAGTMNIWRWIETGIRVGAAYRFEVTAQLTGPAVATTYAIGAMYEGATDPVTLTETPQQLAYEWIADDPAAIPVIQCIGPITVTGPTENLERAAFTDIKVIELATDYPVRLRDTVYESNLANHFDLACNSVGASWHVGRDGVTRFVMPGTALPVSAIFTDEPGQGLHYVDIDAAYDTRGMFNRLEVTNYGVDITGELEENDTLVATSDASINAYGTRTAMLDVNLYNEPPYDETLNDRIQELLDQQDEPQLLVSSIRWNAQENLDAAADLEIGQRIRVHYRGTVQDSQIVALDHDIQPTRWMITITLRRL